jgi:cell division protein ZapA (FtsZ GTPase activity inhibitor)
VLGREIQVRSSAAPETVQEVESYVNMKIGEVSASIPAADQQLVTLLTLLNITESYLSLSKNNSGDIGDLQKNIDRIVARIDYALGDGKLPES